MSHLEPDPQFESHVRHSLGFLFVEHEAKLVSNERLPGTGNAQIFIRVLNMDLRIIQKEGSLSVLASPGHSASSWQSIESLLMAIDPNGKFPPPPVYGSLTELSRLLEPRLLRFNDDRSTERFASTLQDARQSRIKGMIALTPRGSCSNIHCKARPDRCNSRSCKDHPISNSHFEGQILQVPANRQ